MDCTVAIWIGVLAVPLAMALGVVLWLLWQMLHGLTYAQEVSLVDLIERWWQRGTDNGAV